MPIERAIGRAIFQSLAAERISAARMISYVKEVKATYRYQDMLSDIREFTSRAKYQRQIERLSGEKMVPRGWMPERELNMPRRYLVHGEATWMDKETGRLVTEHRSMYTEDYKNKGGWEGDAEDYMSEKSPEPPGSWVGFAVKSAEHNKGWDYQ